MQNIKEGKKGKKRRGKHVSSSVNLPFFINLVVAKCTAERRKNIKAERE